MTTSIVLAGGQSLRLGEDKLEVMLGGESLIQRVIGRLVLLSDEVIVVFSQGQISPPLLPQDKVKKVTDFYPGKGALGGIYTGLMKTSSFHNIVVACDMPFLNLKLLRYMLDLSLPFDAVVPRVKGMLEPLHAVYSRNCLDIIRERLLKDDLQINNILPLVKVRYIEEVEIDKFDPEHLSFFNINTKDELRQAKELAKSMK
jgi:molybdopterin-guanine dinucleotide biosynthesis protein A